MLSATGHRTLGQSTLRSTIFLERRFRAHVVLRDKLLFDNLHAAPSRAPSEFVHLYASLRGACSVADGPAIEGPQAYVLAGSEFEDLQPGAMRFRSWGAPCVVVELRVRAIDLRAPIGVASGPLALPSAVWDAYAALEAERSDTAVHTLVRRLGEAKIVAADVPTSVVEVESERFQLLWSVLRPLYEDLASASLLKQVSVVTRLSMRQIGRDLGELMTTFGLFGAGFRDAMRALRLRAAALMLSAPDATATEVARLVGYGSLPAMARAFRDARLPAPREVQTAVRYPG